MAVNPVLIELLSNYKASGMQPGAAAAALMSTGRTSFFQGISESALQTLKESLLPAGSVEPGELALAMADVFGAGLSAAELASILHTEFPQAPALEIAQSVIAALPNTDQATMYAALTGCGFAVEDAQGTVNILYPATVTVQSNQAWQATGVTVTGQQSTAIACSGSWTANPSNGMCGPEGDSFFIAKDGYTLPGAPEGAVIGQIGSNAPFLVGSSQTAPAGQSGMLSLCINDDLHGLYGAGLTDNVGTMSATVTTSA